MTTAQVKSPFGVVTCASALVPQARVELATFRLGGGCSIH